MTNPNNEIEAAAEKYLTEHGRIGGSSFATKEAFKAGYKSGLEAAAKEMKTLYACGVDWQEEIGKAQDLEGEMPLYSSVEELKEKKICWKECGIVEIELKLVKWVEPQDLI